MEKGSPFRFCGKTN